ncbi:homocitrate synthase [Candidatus Bathyarchaeota archaeon RBG_16_48_13]|nr:MAG: homocitrate synthase [Candidatus Bathyarchaeota archaeon RBG_16_48_13]
MIEKAYILDSTLREGEQTPGVSFTIPEKIEIAQKLDEIGVPMIEAGHPNVSPDVHEAVKKIASLGLKAEILAHARAVKADVDAAARCDVDRVAIFLGTSYTHLHDQLHLDQEEAVKRVMDVVTYARSHGLKVRFTAEDASRTEYNYLLRICRAAAEAGADRISVPDTVGIMRPAAMGDLYRRLVKEVNAEFDAHCHNDLGMAVANSLAALEAGATAVHVSVNGLGERTGIAPLADVATALKVIYNMDTVKLEQLPALSVMVERYSGIVRSQNSPVVGENAFSHKSGVHAAGVLANPATYEAFPPELIGRHRAIIIDKYTGRHAVKYQLERLGIQLSSEQIEAVLERIKNNPTMRNYRDADLVELAEKTSGMSFAAAVPKRVEVVILIKCDSNVYTTAVARKISSLKGVIDVNEISGEFDVEAKVVADSVSELNQTLEGIRGVGGVIGTNSSLILKKFGSNSQ